MGVGWEQTEAWEQGDGRMGAGLGPDGAGRGPDEGRARAGWGQGDGSMNLSGLSGRGRAVMSDHVKAAGPHPG